MTCFYDPVFTDKHISYVIFSDHIADTDTMMIEYADNILLHNSNAVN